LRESKFLTFNSKASWRWDTEKWANIWPFWWGGGWT